MSGRKWLGPLSFQPCSDAICTARSPQCILVLPPTQATHARAGCGCSSLFAQTRVFPSSWAWVLCNALHALHALVPSRSAYACAPADQVGCLAAAGSAITLTLPLR